MKILFFGDSITDAIKRPEEFNKQYALGGGFVRIVADRLLGDAPDRHTIINSGISGNRIVDLYARIKTGVWHHEPELISILIGINDIWHEITHRNGVELERFEKVYRMIIEDTQKKLPNAKFILMEPFVLEGTATCPTEEMPDRYERFCEVYEYAKLVKRLAEEYGLYFLPLQERFNEASAKYGAEYFAADGVHPNVGGSSLIATEWMKLYNEKIAK